MARLRLRLIRFGDRDGLETSEATRTRGRLPSVAAGARTDTTWQSREIVGIRNWVLGTEWGIACRRQYRAGHAAVRHNIRTEHLDIRLGFRIVRCTR